ncbi:DNA topoisomerase 2-alpha-like isoform X2 [Varroa destructor]|uniref:DNA topoisomerase 2 n=1 Tax=Varroa destructor TaxID=109461 RepID=A0A7M7JSN6_VARDE|nr:DNA topoisomerase 2-alpha-like isoform X2 [Varroa destructor]
MAEDIEKIYQKKSQLEHILLRPDTYIGSVEPDTRKLWVYDGPEQGMVYRDVTFVPGLYKIFDEILVNAADNKQRDRSQDCIKVEIDAEKGMISVWNNGKGIPVVTHKTEKCYVPTLIFGHLLTSSNYNDNEKKVTGGRNGYGAKLCNIFSTKFTLETSSRQHQKAFKQTWTNNMTKAGDPKIADSDRDYTKVTFHPDLSKFSMNKFDKDFVALVSRRAYDVAGCTAGVKVYLNGEMLPIRTFKDYVQMFTSKCVSEDDDKPLTVVHEVVSPRWEVACCPSPEGEFKQMSFVNNIATTKGGTHVDYVMDAVTKKLSEQIKKKNKQGVNISKKQMKDHMWIFVNCLIENPSFDSQTKEYMTLQVKKFGSTCELSDKFYNGVLKSGIVDAIMTFVHFKAQKEMTKKCFKTKHAKLKGIPKLEDANDAGTAKSVDCTLILTEGDSAKTLAVSGLGVIGRDRYGVFPLRGKLLNVREATTKQLLENAEINNIIKICGLQYKKKYENSEDMKTLRYGRIMIMTDQDQDGSHIKGLLINFVHHNWPSLLRMDFLEEFITPIVKAFKGSNRELSFFSLPEFEEWKSATPNWNTWRIKYYKGLGTSTAKEAKEYFSNMTRHRIPFRYTGAEDDSSITLAFSKKMVEERKTWLTQGMEERKQRREMGLPEIYLYNKDTKAVSFHEFVHKELILFSNMDNERSIPSLVDGLKPGQRKVLFTCLKRNDKREVKVAQLAGSVAEMSAYHHGEQSLMMTIINLAQNFVGSNNINLLQPIGQFGTRLQGGKDSASPRYIFTKLSPLARFIFPALDDPILNNLYDDNQKIEPEYYLPIIPMVLVNGAEGIGTGWSTKIPNYNPRDVMANVRRLIRDEPLKKMQPWYKGFEGEIATVDAGNRIVIHGEVSLLNNNRVQITELPVKVWTQAYKENVLEVLLHGSEKVPGIISDYREYNTDTKVNFVVTMDAANFEKARSDGMHKVFKLQTTMATTSMVLFDSTGCIRFYDSPEQILEEFYDVRLKGYVMRKEYLIGLLSAEASRLTNQARFIVEKCDDKIRVENKKRKELIRLLIDRGYDPDPVLRWKEAQKTEQEREAEAGVDDDDDEESQGGDSQAGSSSSNQGGANREDTLAKDYDYLLSMTMWSLTLERKEELLKKRDDKIAELEALRRKTPKDLWSEDLDAFAQKLEEVEAKEVSQMDKAEKKTTKMVSAKGAKGKMLKGEATEKGDRITPEIDKELLDKIEKAAQQGAKRKEPKVERVPKFKKEKIKKEPKETKEDKKQQKLNFKPKKPKKEMWDSGTSEEEDKSAGDFSFSDGSDGAEIDKKRSELSQFPTQAPSRDVPKRAKAAVKMAESSGSELDEQQKENSPVKGKGKQPSRQILSSDDEELAPLSKRAENVKKSTQASNTTSSKHSTKASLNKSQSAAASKRKKMHFSGSEDESDTQTKKKKAIVKKVTYFDGSDSDY